MASLLPTPRPRVSITSGAFNTEGHKGHEERRCELGETQATEVKDLEPLARNRVAHSPVSSVRFCSNGLILVPFLNL